MGKVLDVAVQGVRYRGREGQWSWVLHRVTGLGVLLFLVLHVLDTSLVYFKPEWYDHVIGLYRTWVFGIGEILLVGSVVLHGLNGLRIAVLDFWPHYMRHERRLAYVVFALFVVLWVPAGLFMLRTILAHL